MSTGKTVVHMLVRNPGHIDTRVRKTATALEAQGFSVTVFALHEPGVGRHEVLDGVPFERVTYEPTSRDHRTQAYAARQIERSRRYQHALSAARHRKLAATTWFESRRTLAHGSVANLRRIGASRVRERLTVALAWVSLTLGRWALRVRTQHMRLLRLLALVRYRVGTRLAESRWTRREGTHGFKAEWWWYEGFARAVLDGVGDRTPDIVHAHDLNTLWAGLRLSRRSGAALVYDSHELELHRNTTWTVPKRLFARLIERVCIRRADAVITVSDGIADELQRVYRLRQRPAVVLNSPPLDTRELSVPEDRRLRGRLHLDESDRLLVYVGKVAPGRGVEMLVEALPLLPDDVHLALLGPRESRYDLPLFDLAHELGVGSRLHTVPSVPSQWVPAVLAGTDLTVNASQNVCRSYDLALPNKLFDSVMAGVPTVVGRLEAMSRFVREHEIGLVCDELDPADIAETVQKALVSSHAGMMGAQLDALQREVAWEQQVVHLQAVYDALVA